MLDVETLFDWLVAGAPGATSPVQVVERLAPDLVRAGLPLERVEAFVRTLHPHIAGRCFIWTPDRGVEVRENSFAYLHSPEFSESPAAEVCRTRALARRRLVGPDAAIDCDALRALAADGFTDYLAAPLEFLSGQTHAIAFATRKAEGWSPDHVAAIRRIMAPLARVAEIFALSRTATNLLNTYVGRNAGERILEGHIQRGDTDTIRAVIWFSDLRGFTALATALEPNALIRALNEMFECQVPTIERHGGEVLKYMGDGLLAIFPLDAGAASNGAARSVGEVCDAALDAASESLSALKVLNAARSSRGEPEIHFGLAMHVGDVTYGNIGGSGRLDFTCIGPAVNLAARIEGLNSKLGRTMLLSEDFARLTTRSVEAVGAFELKGMTGPQNMFAPA